MAAPKTLEAALIIADAHLRMPSFGGMPDVALSLIVSAARDNFALSQQGGVGARFGVAPKDRGTAGVEAWFTDQAEAVEYAEDWAEPRQVWDLVLGQLVP
jgi:hypothetical protein